jgi:uncharacterized protein
VKTTIRKILNDPVHGFITIQGKLALNIIESFEFQRLRRIKQLGLTHLVYPGALHTRFHHTLGSMHLMQKAIETLRMKGVVISEEESEAAQIAILLHDIGHGPFSHALENTLVHGINHEELSLLYMERINAKFNGQIAMAIAMFKNEYPRKFFKQLIASQLDVDRLDYLKRDSFYTGVSEGIISTARIITMINVVDDELVVEEKGLYSVEKYIIARRLMYWQVYLHKTSLSAEHLMVHILQRARELAQKGEELFSTEALKHFLYNTVSLIDFQTKPNHLDVFSQLDDADISISVKNWVNHKDKILAALCEKLINRKLNRVELTSEPVDKNRLKQMKEAVQKKYNCTEHELESFVYTGIVENRAYESAANEIKILKKDNSIVDLITASDQHNILALSQTVKKHYFSYPKEIKLVNN